MFTENIPLKDYQNILKFIDRILLSPMEVREQVMLSLANIFGYRLSTFWLTDNQNNLIDPMTFSVDWSIMKNYQSHYYSFDPLHPHNIPKKLAGKNVIRLTDVINTEKYKQNKYYKDILSQYKLPYKVVIYYRKQGKFIGGSSLLKSSSTEDFNICDVRRLEILSEFISRALANYLTLKDNSHQKKMFESLSNNSSIGLITFNEYCEILYYNPTAWEFCKELTDDNKLLNPIERFINFFLLNNKPTWQCGLKTTILSSKLKQFTIEIILQVEKNMSYYMVFIKPCYISKEQKLLSKKNPLNDLTSREREILSLVLKGFTNQEIADELFISLPTVKAHIQNIFKKFNVKNRTSLCYKFSNHN